MQIVEKKEKKKGKTNQGPREVKLDFNSHQSHMIAAWDHFSFETFNPHHLIE